jgi:hypothetical protein
MSEHKTTAQELADKVMKLDSEIAAFLRGRGPHEIGAILGELVSRWLAGHAPQVRDQVWDKFQELVLDLTPIQEMIMFGGEGHPARKENWNAKDDTHSG